MAITQSCTLLYFVCVENIIEGLIAGILLILMLIGLSVIINDRNQVLVKIDKAIYTLSTIQVFLVFCMFTFQGNDFVLSTVKCFNIFTGALICNILSTIIFDETHYETIWTILKVVLGLVLLEWFWTAVVHKSLQEFNCFQRDYLILSATFVVVSWIAVFFGAKALYIIQKFREEKRSQLNQGADDLGTMIVINDMRNREIQIKILICIRITFIIVSLGLVAKIQFLWDYLSYKAAIYPIDCNHYFYPESYLAIAVLVFLKCFVLMGFPSALYVVFYQRNKTQFNLTQPSQAELLLQERELQNLNV